MCSTSRPGHRGKGLASLKTSTFEGHFSGIRRVKRYISENGQMTGKCVLFCFICLARKWSPRSACMVPNAATHLWIHSSLYNIDPFLNLWALFTESTCTCVFTCTFWDRAKNKSIITKDSTTSQNNN
jgi:hypothetical protein